MWISRFRHFISALQIPWNENATSIFFYCMNVKFQQKQKNLHQTTPQKNRFVQLHFDWEQNHGFSFFNTLLVRFFLSRLNPATSKAIKLMVLWLPQYLITSLFSTQPAWLSDFDIFTHHSMYALPKLFDAVAIWGGVEGGGGRGFESKSPMMCVQLDAFSLMTERFSNIN